ncbi:deaminase [Kocuria rosea]|jgi:dihydrofolate reductase|nr:dihydrofolate reductase family protein [Kocuria rosea]MCC5783626.1 deaminase [Kocuria sp. CCUG 69068]PWF84042.1 deaminase [Kocuria rosea]QCY34430.1 dihydrofolate reductase [Kocuria rosea]THE19117.1 dihydrofolate reductase [Kocuria rosea]TQN38691.1 dihydrofolate reductase [Kocuria rosea]
MGALVMIEFLTVDGVMQGLGSPGEDPEGGFVHGGWGAPYAGSVHQVTASAGFARTSSYLFGRRTYEKMAAFWPHQPADNPVAAHLNATPKYVASRTLTEAAWPGTRILSTDAVDAVRGLRAGEDGDIAVLGSGVLCRELLAEDLVDEIRLFVHPLLLGSGKRLFGELPVPRRLALRSVARTDLGTVALVYGTRA